MAQKERRRTIRVSEKLPLTFEGGGTEFTAETKNISAAGAYCTTDKFIAPMSKLQIRFELPDDKRDLSIRCSGVVVRIEPVISNVGRGRYNVAVFFTKLAERDRLAIDRFVRKRLPASFSTQ